MVACGSLNCQTPFVPRVFVAMGSQLAEEKRLVVACKIYVEPGEPVRFKEKLPLGFATTPLMLGETKLTVKLATLLVLAPPAAVTTAK